ncbi:MAG TPA: AI-2E family transporter [Thermodesulfobacteriota bacterium]|nr:AI-2E family transporter [Thermodesulfobacteriota bacterium]
MKKEHLPLMTVVFFTFLSFYLFYQIFSPFLLSILWGVVLAIAFHSLFHKLKKLLKQREGLSSLVMTFLVTLVIVLPFTLLSFSLAREVIDTYHRLEEMIRSGELQGYLEQVKRVPLFQSAFDRLSQTLDLSHFDPVDFLLKNVQQISTFLFNRATTIFKGLSTFLIGFFFSLLSLYYLFKDGDRLLEKIKEMSPIPSGERDLFLLRFEEMIHATFRGGILVAIIQGILGGLSFWILGISSPILWGTGMAILSFIPVGGTALVWVPASLFLWIQGAWVKAFILLGIGVFVISMVDNILRPALISSKTNIHPLLLFFAVLGGIQAFGLIGLLLGPLITSLCLTIIEIYIQGIKEE